MIPAKIVVRDRPLLGSVIVGADDIVHPPLVAGCGREHTAHQVIVPVRMGKGVKRIVLVNAKAPAGNKNRAGGAERDVASTLTDCSCAHRL